jgi:hypothetical protein
MLKSHKVRAMEQTRQSGKKYLRFSRSADSAVASRPTRGHIYDVTAAELGALKFERALAKELHT